MNLFERGESTNANTSLKNTCVVKPIG